MQDTIANTQVKRKKNKEVTNLNEVEGNQDAMKQTRQTSTSFFFHFAFFFWCLALGSSAGGKDEILQLPRIAVKEELSKAEASLLRRYA